MCIRDRRNGLLGENQNDDCSFVDRPDDFICVQSTGDDIPRGNPALDAVALKSLDDGIGNSHVLRCVADKDAGRATARLFVVTVFGHSQSPACAASSRMPYGLATGHGWETRNDRDREANQRRRRTGCGRLLTDRTLFPVDLVETLEPGGSLGLRTQTFSAPAFSLIGRSDTRSGSDAIASARARSACSLIAHDLT